MSLGSRILLILFYLPIFGFFAGSGFYSWTSSDNRIEWKFCGSPPFPAVSLSNIPNGVVVDTKNGDTYLLDSCQLDGWTLIENTAEKETEDIFYEFCGDVHPPDIDKVINSTETCDPWEYGYSYDKYALLEDGSVWAWSKVYGGVSLGFFMYPFFGSISFFILGIFISIFMKILNVASHFDEKNKNNASNEPES